MLITQMDRRLVEVAQLSVDLLSNFRAKTFGLILISCANYSIVSAMFIDSRTDREEPSDLI